MTTTDGGEALWAIQACLPALLLSPSGTPISGSSGYTGGGTADPSGLAIDGAGNVWVAGGTYTISEFNSKGVQIPPNGYYATSDYYGFAGGLVIDASGNLWAANNQGASNTLPLVEFVGVATPVLTPKVACLAQSSAKAVCLP